jgi:hypothetical protein
MNRSVTRRVVLAGEPDRAYLLGLAKHDRRHYLNGVGVVRLCVELRAWPRVPIGTAI